MSPMVTVPSLSGKSVSPNMCVSSSSMYIAT